MSASPGKTRDIPHAPGEAPCKAFPQVKALATASTRPTRENHLSHGAAGPSLGGPGQRPGIAVILEHRAAKAKPEPLPCPSDNISVSRASDTVIRTAQAASQPAQIPATESTESNASQTPPTRPQGNAVYWSRRALEIEINAPDFIRRLGQKYKLQANARSDDWYNGLSDAEAGLCHALEFTITLDPNTAGRIEDSGKYFNERWKAFNDRWLRYDERFGDWLRVLEPQKSGLIHAHILIESSCRIPHDALRWRKTREGKTVVAGDSCPPWLTACWKELRGEPDGPEIGVLRRFGFGYRHTLQPIKQGGAVAGKYFAKYIRKGIGTPRKDHLSGLRMCDYSRAFPRCARAVQSVKDDDGNPVRVEYWSEKHQEYRERILCKPGFDPNTHSARRRRKDMAIVAEQLEFKEISEFAEKLGPRWAWYANPVIALADYNDEQLEGLLHGEPWELVAKARAMARYTRLEPWYIVQVKGEERIWRQSEFDFCNDFEVKQAGNWEFAGFYKPGAGTLMPFEEAFRETWFAREFFWGKLRERMTQENGTDGFETEAKEPVAKPRERGAVLVQGEFEPLRRKGAYHVA